MSWFDRVHRHGRRSRVRSGGLGVRLSSRAARRQRLRDCVTPDAKHSRLDRARLSDFRSDRCAVHTESSLSPHQSGLAGVRRRVSALAAPPFIRSTRFTTSKSTTCAGHCRCPRACVHCPRRCTYPLVVARIAGDDAGHGVGHLPNSGRSLRRGGSNARNVRRRFHPRVRTPAHR